jgi:flagellar protein FliJ
MKSGETLIRLAKHKVDSVQKLIAAAEQTRAGVVQKREDLAAKTAREKANAERDHTTIPNWLAYNAIAETQRANLDASLDGIDQQLDALRGDLQGAFEEQKKFEMLEERRQAHIKAGKDKRAQAFMDETALIRASRRA